MRIESRHCGSCGQERPFVAPPCVDGHGEDCPEWACTGCGAALLVNPHTHDGYALGAAAVAAAGPDSPAGSGTGSRSTHAA